MVRPVRPAEFGRRGQRPVRSPDGAVHLERPEEAIDRRGQPVGEPRHRPVDVAHRAADLVREFPVQREAQVPRAQLVRPARAFGENQQILLDQAAARQQRVWSIEVDDFARRLHPEPFADPLETLPAVVAEPVDDEPEDFATGRFRVGQHLVDQGSALGTESSALVDFLLPAIVQDEPTSRVEGPEAHRELPGPLEELERYRGHASIERRQSTLSSHAAGRCRLGRAGTLPPSAGWPRASLAGA